MNLRIETEVEEGGDTVPLTLFHVRMHDLKSREFSIRRYERSSGRDVCQTRHRYKKNERAKLTSDDELVTWTAKKIGNARTGRHQMAFNDALTTSRAYSSSHRRTSSVESIRPRTSTSSLKSVPENPNSNNEGDDIDDPETSSKRPEAQISTNTTKIEFSNYAQVEVSRRGTKETKK
jgi:hypothetical protein